MATPQNPLGPIEIVCVNSGFIDPWIDMSEPDPPADGQSPAPSVAQMLGKYFTTRDISVLRGRPEQSPSLFVVKPLGHRAVALTLDVETSEPRRFFLAFLMACHEVKVPGEPQPWRCKLAGARREDGAVLPTDPDEWLDRVRDRFGMDSIYEVGSVAWQRARLRAGAPFSYLGGLGLNR